MSKTTKNIEYIFSAKDTNVSSTVDKMNSGFDKLENKAQKSAGKMKTTGDSAKKLGSSVKQAGKDILYMDSSLSSLATKIHNANTKNDKMTKTMKEVSSANKTAASSLTTLKNELRTLSKNKDYDLEKTNNLKNATKELGDTINQSKKGLETTASTINQLTNAKRVMLEQLTKAEQVYGKNSEEVKKLREDYNNISATLGQMKIKYKEESDALNRLSQQYDSHKSKLDVFEEKAKQANKAEKALEKMKATNEALYNKELLLHNSIQKTNRELQSKTLATSKATTEMSNYRKKIQEISKQLEEESKNRDFSTKSLARYESQMRVVNTTVDRHAHTVKKLEMAKENLEQTIKEKELAYKKLNTTMKSHGQEAERLKSDIAQLEDEYNDLCSELNKAQSEFDEMKSDAKGLESQLKSCKKELEGFSGALKKMDQVGDTFGKIGKGVTNLGNVIQQAGRGITNVGNSMRWMTALGTAVFGGAIKSGLEFDQAMADLASTIDTTELSADGLAGTMSILEDKVRSLAKATIFNPTEVAQGMKYLSLAGYSTKDMLASIEPMLKAAQIAGLDLASTTDLLTDAMASYRLETSSMPKFLDAMAKLQASSNTTIAQATEAYIWAGGTLADYNVSLEESASLIGIMANQGLKGAEAGRSLSSIMVNLTKTSGESYAALQKLHELTGKDIFAFDKNGNYKGLENQLKTLKEALYNSNLTEADRVKIIQSIAGKTQMKTFTKLLGQINGEYDTLKSKVRNANGELDRMHETVSQSNWAKFKEMLSAIQEALLKIWEAIQPLVMFIVNKITELANKFSNLSKEQQMNIIKMLAFISLIPLGLKLLGGCIGFIGGVVKAIGWAISAAGTAMKIIGSMLKGLLGFGKLAFSLVSNIISKGFIGGILAQFPKLASVVETIQICFMYFAGFLKSVVMPALTATAFTIGTLTIPVWLVMAAIVALTGIIAWGVNAWKRGFDSTAGVIENIGNMFKEMGKDIGHFFVSVWNSLSGLIGKLTGKSKEEIEEMKKLSQKDKEAIEEGYDNYKDKKTQQKAQKKADKEVVNQATSGGQDILAGAGDFIKNGLGKLEQGITMNIDDGGFFSEFGNFMDGYEEFVQEFENNKKEATFETKVEADVLEIIEARDTLSNLQDEYSEMEVNVELAKDAVAYCNDRIQELIAEKRELEIKPEANKKRLGEIEKELEKLTERRETNLEIIENGDKKLAEIEEAYEALKDKKVTLVAEYKEEGKDEEFEKLLNEETFYRKFGYELVHDNFESDVKFIEDRINNIPNEIDELEAKIALETDPEKKNALINELTALQEEKVIMELTLEYVKNTETLQQTQNEIDSLKERYKELDLESKKIEWVSKQGIELTKEQKNRLSEIKTEQEELNGKIKEQEENQSKANKALKEMDASGNIEKVVEYMDELATKQEETKIKAEETDEALSGIAEKASGINFDEGTMSAEGFAEQVGEASCKVDEIHDKAGTETTLNIDTTDAETGINNISTALDNSEASIDSVSSKLANLKSLCANISLEGLSSALDGAASNIGTIRETLISINKIAGSTTVQSFNTAGQALITKLTEARQKVLDTSNVARNYGVNAMNTMGQSLTDALSGARLRVFDVANVAKNYGAGCLKAMGQALVNQLNTAKSMVASIASAARSIKISIPTPSSGGSGGSSRSLLTAQYDDFVMPALGIRSLAGATAVNSSSTSNSFNFNIDRVVMDKNTNIKDTAKQFTRMCQREGVLK